MREDMPAVVAERNRFWSRCRRWRFADRKGYRKLWRKLEQSGEPPAREPMGRRTGRTFRFDQAVMAMNPLRRFLLARVGRMWDAVWSELCRAFPRGSEARREVQRWVRLPVGLRAWYWRNGIEVGEDGFGPHGSPGGWTCREVFFVGPEGRLGVR